MKNNIKLNLFLLCTLSIFFLANRGGSPGGRSGSTSDNGATCSTNGGCHGGSSPQSKDILSSNIPATGYAAGKTYNITVNPTENGTSVWGFEMMAEDANGNSVGEFLNNTQVNSLSSGSRATHKFASSSSNDGQSWIANWKAPSSGTGKVVFYVSTLAANGNGNNSGDQVFIDTIHVQENANASIHTIANVQILLSPNPTTNTIHIDGYSNSSAKIQVLNGSGSVVLSHPFKQVLDVSLLQSGVYYLKLIEEERVFTKTFVKH